jgi:hypothetical protein
VDTEYSLEWYDGVSGNWYGWDTYDTREAALETAADPTVATPEKLRLVTTITETL